MKKRKFFFNTVILCIVIHQLLSCSLMKGADERIGSNIVGEQDAPTLDSDTVGILWNKNHMDTNISHKSVDYKPGSRIADPVIIKKDDTYHLWFTAISNASGGSYSIRYAFSTDGITWHNNVIGQHIVLLPDESGPVNPSDDCGGVRLGAVIWDNESKEFKMWYRGKGEDGKERILFARSKSPSKGWVKYPNDYRSPTGKMPKSVLDLGTEYDRKSIGNLSVNKKTTYDGYAYHYLYEMWYSARGKVDDPAAKLEINLEKNRIMYAKSDNGINWTKAELPVLDPEETAFDYAGKYTPTVIYHSYKGEMMYKLFYLGEKEDASGEKVQKLGMAYSTSGDIFNFYDHTAYTDGLSNFPYPVVDPDLPESHRVADPWVIRDKYAYKMWYVQETVNRATGKITASTLKFIESW